MPAPLPPHVASQLVELERHLPSALVRGTEVSVGVDADGRLHTLHPAMAYCLRQALASPRSRGRWSWGGSSSGVRTLPLGELASSEGVCDHCVTVGFLVPEASPLVWVSRSLRALSSLSKRPRASSALMRRRSESQAALDRLEEHPLSFVPVPGLPDGGEEAVSALAAALRTAVAESDSALDADRMRPRLLEEAKVSLVGRDAVLGGYVFEEDEVLVGLASHSSSAPRQLLALAGAFSVRDDDAGRLVLRVPRYVADLVSATARSRSTGLHPTAALLEGDSDAVVEAAAALWDPDALGPLSSLSGALQAARLLVQPPVSELPLPGPGVPAC